MPHLLKLSSSVLYVYESEKLWGIVKIKLPNAIKSRPVASTIGFECLPPKYDTGMQNNT